MAKRTASAKKQARAGVRRTLRNRAVRSEVKTKVTKARRTLSASAGPTAESDRYALALDAVRALDRAAAKGVLHPNNAARRKARLVRQLVKLGVPAAGAGVAGVAGKKRGAAGGRGKGAAAAAASSPAPAGKGGDKKGGAPKKSGSK